MRPLPNEAQPELDGFLDLAIQLRRAGCDYVELGRQLMVLADQIERRDGCEPLTPIGDVARRVLADAMGRERDD